MAKPFTGSIENPVKIQVVSESGTFFFKSIEPVKLKSQNGSFKSLYCLVMLNVFDDKYICLPLVFNRIPNPSFWEIFTNSGFGHAFRLRKARRSYHSIACHHAIANSNRDGLNRIGKRYQASILCE